MPIKIPIRAIFTASLAVLLCVSARASLDPNPPPGRTAGANLLELTLGGSVDVNGAILDLAGTATFDDLTGDYVLKGLDLAGAPAGLREQTLLSLLPRAALALLAKRDVNTDSYLARSGGSLTGSLLGSRKVDPGELVSGDLTLHRQTAGGPVGSGGNGGMSVTETSLLLDLDATLRTGADRPLRADGDSALRLGLNPSDGTLLGGARLAYDSSLPDPESLGNADLWDLSGKFEGLQLPANESMGYVDQGTGDLLNGSAEGTATTFPVTTVAQPGVLTLSGTATRDGVLTQELGLSNLAGKATSQLQVDLPVSVGDSAVAVAGKLASELNRLARTLDLPLLAVQGGDGKTLSGDPQSPRVALSVSLDGRTIADPLSEAACSQLLEAGTQVLASPLVRSLSDAGLESRLGLLGDAQLPGVMTPLQVSLHADDPANGHVAAGGGLALLLQGATAGPGGVLPETITSFPEMLLPTHAGETAETVAKHLADLLASLESPPGLTLPRYQRLGETLLLDAGLEAPLSLALSSLDRGLGYSLGAMN